MNDSSLFRYIPVLLVLCVGCAGMAGPSAQRQEAEKKQLIAAHLETARGYEERGDLPEALAQYELVLTLHPRNEIARRKKKKIESQMVEVSETHYQSGIACHNQGNYQRARQEFLLALRFKPDHAGALEMLTPHKKHGPEPFVIHDTQPGESLSKIAALYYGDYRKYPILAKFNSLVDATKIRAGQAIKVPILPGIPFMPHQKEAGTQPESPTPPPEIPPPSGEAPTPSETREDQPVDTATHPTPAPEVAAIPGGAIPGAEMGVPPVPAPPVEEPPKEPPDPLSGYVSKYREMGIAFFKEKKYRQAIDKFEKVVEMTPEDPVIRDYLFQSHYQSAMVLFERGDYLPAKEEFDAAVQYSESCENCETYSQKSELLYKERHYNQGITYFTKEQLAEAIREWEKVRAIDPAYKSVRENIRKARTLLDRLEEIKKSAGKQEDSKN